MPVFTRRNAVVGWFALTIWKRAWKRTAKNAVPAIDKESKRPNKSALALIAAGTVGALALRQKLSGNEETPEA